VCYDFVLLAHIVVLFLEHYRTLSFVGYFLLKEVYTCLMYMDLRLRVTCFLVRFYCRIKICVDYMNEHLCTIELGPDYEF
jgi:hypothetical protein